jgi:LD-carboxypeptidase N-terminal domain
MFADPDVSLIMPASGGTGAAHLADLLDYPLIRAHPKLFTAFSDPSVLNNSILAAAGLPSVHGASEDAPDARADELILRCVKGTVPGHHRSRSRPSAAQDPAADRLPGGVRPARPAPGAAVPGRSCDA